MYVYIYIYIHIHIYIYIHIYMCIYIYIYMVNNRITRTTIRWFSSNIIAILMQIVWLRIVTIILVQIVWLSCNKTVSVITSGASRETSSCYHQSSLLRSAERSTTIGSGHFSFNIKCDITSETKSLRETLSSSESLYFALARIKASTN